jgi:YbbR domain-containing protein
VQNGYVIEGITTEPSTATIVGNPRTVAALSFADTERIDVSDASSTLTRQVALAVPDSVSVLEQEVVRVTVRIVPLVLTQAITAVPIPEGLRPGLQVTSPLPSVQVVFQGPASALRALGAGDFRAIVDLDGLGPGAHRATVDVEPPAGISVQAVNPRVIGVTLGDSGLAMPGELNSPPG